MSTSVIFTGDIGFSRYMEGRYEDEQFLAPKVLDFFRSAEHVCANVEGAMFDASDDGEHGIFFHSMSPNAAKFLAKIKADIWCIGNNHSMDAGDKGVKNTRKIAKNLSAQALGAGLNIDEASAPVYIEGAGGIGIINVSYQPDCIPATEAGAGNFSWDDWTLIAKRIAEIKAKCRYCVVVAHGGEEFACLPTPYTRDRYIKYLGLGADAVVGHHPHVAENYERFADGKLIFYSLGNFVFDTDYQRAHRYTDRGVLLKLIFTSEKIDFEAIGIQILRGEQKIKKSELPDIFTNIPADEYALLSPFAAKAFVQEEKRRMVFMEPRRFSNATEKEWNNYFFSTEPEGYVAEQHMDFGFVIPFSQTANPAAWQKSKLNKVKEYIATLTQI